MKSRKILIVGSMILIGVWGWLSLFGNHLPYFNSDPRQLASYLVENNRSAEECWDIVIFDLFSAPPPSLQRANCIEEYAKIAKDPTVCELIMPSNSGLSCINQSIDTVFKDNPKGEDIDIDAKCSIYDSNPIQKDYCLFSQAHRSKNLSTCEEILNTTIKIACHEKIGAWYEYPALRTSSYFGKYREGNTPDSMR